MCIPFHMNKFESSPIVKAFRASLSNIPDSGMLSYICGVSGGIDSMVLLYLFHKHNLTCITAHCNYGLRGEASDMDMELVEQVSAMWGLECVSAVFNTAEADEKNTQLWARKKRYDMFRDLKREFNTDFICTAHHQDDQVETILQKIFRGSSISTWSGMQICENDIFRPLLTVSRQEIYSFARKHHVPYREDHTNAESSYARNLIRNELVREMDALLPGWKKNVLNLRQKGKEFDLMAKEILRSVRKSSDTILRDELIKLPRRLWPVVIHRFFRDLAGPEEMPSSGELEEAEELDQLQTGAKLHFGNQFILVRDRDRFLAKRKDEINQRFKSVQITPGKLPVQITGTNFWLRKDEWNGTVNPETLQVDRDKVTWPITIRRWQDGDRIQPLGMEGHKLISDVLTDSKISTARKKEGILIESFDGTISAVIFPHKSEKNRVGLISEGVKCSSGTKRILRIDTGI